MNQLLPVCIFTLFICTTVVQSCMSGQQQQAIPIENTGGCPAGFFGHFGSCYHYVDDAPRTWEEAEDDCEAHDSYLFVANSQDELDALSNLNVVSGTPVWIGIRSDRDQQRSPGNRRGRRQNRYGPHRQGNSFNGNGHNSFNGRSNSNNFRFNWNANAWNNQRNNNNNRRNFNQQRQRGSQRNRDPVQVSWQNDNGIDPERLPWQNRNTGHGRQAAGSRSCVGWARSNGNSRPIVDYYPCSQRNYYLCELRRSDDYGW